MFLDRVRDTTQSTGTGNLTLDGVAPVGFRAFSAFWFQQDMFYCIVDTTTGDWEIGYGHFDPGTGILQRNTGNYAVLSSSNADAAVNFAAGEKEVFNTLPSAFLGEGRVTVSQFAPSATMDETYGYVANKSAWIEISGGNMTMWVYAGGGTWTEIPVAAWQERVDDAFAGLVPATQDSVDLTGKNKFANTTDVTLSGAKGRGHANTSHVFGHGWPAGETGFGCHQSEVQGIVALTTDATPTEITERLYLQERGAGLYRVHVVAYSDAGDYKAWSGEILMYRGYSVAPTIDTSTLAEVGASAGAAAWAVALSAGTGSGADGIKAVVTGAAATTIHWTVATFATFAHNSTNI